MRRCLSFLLPVAVLLLLTTCEPVKLPPETQEGANTFGCRINGKKWVPTGTPGKPSGGRYPGVNGGFYKIGLDTTFYLYIRAYKDEESVELWARNVTKAGNYELKYSTETKPNALFPLNYASVHFGDEYVTTNVYNGWVNVTKADTLTGLVAGTFEFTAVNRRDPSKTLRVTDGRFDVKP